MKQQSEKWERLVALFCIGFVLLNFPMLAMFDNSHMVAGIPILYVYLFSVWIALIAISAWIIERR